MTGAEQARALLPVGMHECVTCARCATTFAAVHPACPRCAAEAALRELRPKAEAWDSGPTAVPDTSEDLKEAWREAYLDRMREKIEAEAALREAREALREIRDEVGLADSIGLAAAVARLQHIHTVARAALARAEEEK